MSSHPEPARRLGAHRYALFKDRRQVGWLQWRAEPRSSAGWFLVHEDGGPVRLKVDSAIDELAGDTRSDADAWGLYAEVAALLSTAMALDAAERTIHDRPRRTRQRFRRLDSTSRYQISVKHTDPEMLSLAVPELALSSVGDVAVLEGDLLADVVPAVLRRLQLLGGEVTDVSAQDADDR